MKRERERCRVNERLGFHYITLLNFIRTYFIDKMIRITSSDISSSSMETISNLLVFSIAMLMNSIKLLEKLLIVFTHFTINNTVYNHTLLRPPKQKHTQTAKTPYLEYTSLEFNMGFTET